MPATDTNNVEPIVRAHETSIEIDRPIEEVWAAITESEALARLFAPKMAVEPGVGGFVAADWGPGILWKTNIEVWEPNKHLRLVERRDHLFTPPGIEQKFEAQTLIQDYYLETTEGWDEEYEGTKSGWAGCFLRLKHVLEDHRGETVDNRVLTRVCLGITAQDALRRIEHAVAPDLRIEHQSHNHICGTLPAHNGSTFNASVSRVDAGSVAYIELLMYGLPPDRVTVLETEYRARLASLFADAPGN